MTQEQMLRAEVYTRALRVSRNLKEGSLEMAGRPILQLPQPKVGTAHVS